MKRLLSIAFAVLTLSVSTVSAFDMEAMSAEERDAFRAEIRAYLLDNPEVLMEAIGVLEQRQAEAQVESDRVLVQTNAEALFDDGFSYVGGNPDGDITVVEFLDYRCAYCRKAHPEVAGLLEADGNIRLIVKELPILGPDSTASSKFAIAVKQVAGPEAYKQISEHLITMRGQPTTEALRRVAEDYALDADAVLARMEGPEVAAEIEETLALAQRMQINGTPTFVLGQELVRGYVPLATMQEIIAAARAEG